MAAAVNNFGWRYFRTLNRAENIFYSPYSLAAALSLVANGATRATRAEILAALGAANVGVLNSGFKSFRAVEGEIYSDANILRDASLILVNKKYAVGGLNPTFENITADTYGSEVRTADFEGDLSGERAKITAWVDEKTAHFIPDFKAAPTADTIIALLNTIYFKSDWDEPFSDERTDGKFFTNRDGSKSFVQMMRRTFEFYTCYHSDENFRGIRLPYKNRNAAMYLIMARNKQNLNVADDWSAATSTYRKNFIAQLDTATMHNGQQYTGDFEVELPRFELDVENNLVEKLAAVGIQRIFTNRAEFFNLVEGVPLKINNGVHLAKIKVAERGTEAGALSWLDGKIIGSAPFGRKVVKFHVDRPFIFVIRDIRHGLNLFVGAVNVL